MTTSLAHELVCIDCATGHPLEYRLECAKCGGLLELRYDVDRLRRGGPAVLSGTGLWRYAPVLPISDPQHRVTLGEGGTPLLECPTGVATLAVLEKLVATKTLDGAQDICVVVSETGLKTEAELPSREGIAFDEPSLRRLVAERLGTRS